MKEIKKETFDKIYDPVAKCLWEKWLLEGSACFIQDVVEATPDPS